MNITDANVPGNKLPVATNGKPPAPADHQFLQTLMTHTQGDAAVPGPAVLSATPTLSGLLRALKRRWMLAFSLAALAAAAAVFVVFQIFPPQYLAVIRLRVAAKQLGPEDVEFPIFKADMEWRVKSPLVLTSALNEQLPDGREVKDLAVIRDKGMGAIEWLEKTLKTDYLLGPEILKVTLAADQPEEASELLNAIAKAFLKECKEMESARKQQRLTELRRIKEQHEQKIASLKSILKNQMLSLGIKDPEGTKLEMQSLESKRSEADKARRANEVDIGKLQDEVTSLKKKLNNIDSVKVPDGLLDDLYSKDLTLVSFNKQLLDIDLVIADYQAKYNEPFASRFIRPKQEEKQRIKQLQKRRELELLPSIEKRYRVQVREKYEEDLALASDKLVGPVNRRLELEADVKKLDNLIHDLTNGKPAQIQATEGQIELTWSDVVKTSEKIREVDLEPVSPRVSALEERISPPAHKDYSKQAKLAGVGGLGMFGLVLFGVAFLEFRSRKLSTLDEVTHGLGLHAVGTVPAMPTPPRRPSASSEALERLWQNQLHESVDAVRTVLLHQSRKESLRIILVTSAESGEGKTTLSTQLGASLARAWKRTLVVDGDMRYPTAHKLFEVPSEPGLAEVLRGEIEVASAIRATSFSRLWILPAGNGDNHAIQALAQENVEAIFSALKEQYDFIIVDSPPLLPVTDALLLGQHVDGILLSILRDVSRAPAVYAAQQKLAPLGAHLLGAVVLGVEPEYGKKNYRYMTLSSK